MTNGYRLMMFVNTQALAPPPSIEPHKKVHSKYLRLQEKTSLKRLGSIVFQDNNRSYLTLLKSNLANYDTKIRRINEQSARRLHTPFRENRKRGERVLLSTIRGTGEIASETTGNKALRSRIERTRVRYRASVGNLKQAKKEIR